MNKNIQLMSREKGPTHMLKLPSLQWKNEKVRIKLSALMDESGKGADSYARNDKGSAELTNQLFSLLCVFKVPRGPTL